MTKTDYFEKEINRANEAIRNVCGLDKDVKASYSLYLAELIEDTSSNVTKGLDLHIFAHIQALTDMIAELEDKLEAQASQLDTIEKLFNKLLNK